MMLFQIVPQKIVHARVSPVSYTHLDVYKRQEYLNGDIGKTEAVLKADTEIKHQIVKNFGVSGAWWSTGIGDRATICLLYTSRCV